MSPRCTRSSAPGCARSSALRPRPCRVLYGGSVKPENAASLLALPGVDGALVGGASLKAADFLAIARAARTLSNPAGGG